VVGSSTRSPWARSGRTATQRVSGSATFAGYGDWRVPNRRELDSIVNLENTDPAVSPAFNNNCTPGCTVLTCSCRGLSHSYRLSSTCASGPYTAWFVGFSSGGVGIVTKTEFYHVQAVRGGS
jgi:hypothetical protein